MWFYFKGIREAMKKYPLDAYKPGDDPRNFGADVWIGYTLTHYPIFILETVLEVIPLVFLMLWLCK